MAKKTQTQQKTETTQPETQAATSAPAATDSAKKVNNFQASATPLSFEVATPEELQNVPEAPARQGYGLRSQLVDALKGLPVKGGIVVKAQEFKKLKGRVGSINRNKLVKTGDNVHRFYVREHEGKTFVIRES